MKKKLFLALAISIMLVCLFAISISAAEPNYDGETVTLDDGTICPLWDTDGNPLMWYITATDADTGVKTYAYVDATSEAVAYINSSNSANQLDNVTITVDGTEYAKSTIAVANFPNAKITAVSGNAKDARIGEDAIRLYKTFQSCSNLEYAYINMATTSVGQETFKSCSNLKFVNLADLTELTTIGIQAFNSAPKLFDGMELDLTNTKLKELGNIAFYQAKFTSVKVPEATFTTLGSEVFRDCTKLETVTGTAKTFEDGKITSIGANAYRNCKMLKQLDGLIENGILTIPEGVTSVGTFAFTECDGITYIDLPSTFNYVGQQGFSYMSNVKLIDFGKITGTLTLNNCGHFRDMDNLIAVSLPEGMTQISNRAFASCDNLTALYMPNSVEILSTNGDGQGPFCGSKKLYFVQESFNVSQCLVDGVVDTSKLVLPEKPEVYYMPTSLTSFTGLISSGDTYAIATIFRYCESLNDVMVFPESFTDMRVTRAFQEVGTKDSPKTIVFTGDMEEFVITHFSQYITFVFTNENDKDFNDLGIVRTTGKSKETGSSAYFCSTGKKYNLEVSGRVGTSKDYTEEDIANIAATIEAIHATATNETNHIHNSKADKSTDATYLENAKSQEFCFCGHAIKTVEQENTALFTVKGYSKNGDSLVYVIVVNTTAIENYNVANEVNVKYGIVASQIYNDGELLEADGTVKDNTVLNADFTGTNYSLLQIKITGAASYADTALHCCAYVTDGTNVAYLYESEGKAAQGGKANQVKYSDIAD